MPCYHPLKAFPIGITPSGKTDYKITSYAVDHVELNAAGTWEAASTQVVSDRARRFVRQYVEIPCGQCIGCRLEYSRQWANRCMMELESHDSAYFVTLTYNDESLPRSWYADPATGEALPSFTLRKRDLQLFFKRLRKRFPDSRIRYYAAGEYGDTTFRPHYHCIIYGLHLDDLSLYSRTVEGWSYFTSPSLDRVWSIRRSDGTFSPIGFAVIGNVTWETCAYTARYVLKKQTGQTKTFYEEHGLEPEFVLMSRRPGIARDYYDQHGYNNSYSLVTDKKGITFSPPKYFDRLFDVENPDEMASIKVARLRVAQDAQAIKLSKTTLSYVELLAVEEANKLASSKSLIRGDV